ncbi:hypothetical protein H2203_004130 [Taxawa tesnikishii (nom. ined.)]|nr:hypothetical protein H2203_004130 [Dothideales sp. JES 119]
MLGVSLDKVNNWFQNRRAKSKQDAKKQAGAFNLLQASQPGGVSLPFADHIPPAFCAPDFSNAIHGAAFMDGPLTGGQGMGQLMVGQNPRMIHDSVIDGFPGGRLADSGMHLAGSMGQDFSHDDSNRRTLTQEQFDALAQGGSFLHGTSGESMDNELTGLAPDPGMLSDYFPSCAISPSRSSLRRH